MIVLDGDHVKRRWAMQDVGAVLREGRRLHLEVKKKRKMLTANSETDAEFAEVFIRSQAIRRTKIG
jgi:hypothetical protein